jgi:hypothetical protein
VTTAVLRPLPGIASVFREQLHLVWDRDKWQLLALWGCLFMFAPSGYWPGMGVLAFITLFLAGIWAEHIWRDEPAGGRSYHEGMPVPRTRHALMRVAVGLLWLLLLTLLAILPDRLLHFSSLSFITLSFSNLEEVRLVSVPGWLLVAWPMAMVTVYLLISALVVASRRPVLWVSLFLSINFLVLPLLYLGPRRLGSNPLYEAWNAFNGGRFGLFNALLPGHWLTPDLSRIHGYPIPTDPVNLLPSLVWFGFAVVVLLLAVRRRREE